MVDKKLLLAAFILYASTQGEKLFGDDIQTSYQAGDRDRRLQVLSTPPLRQRCHQVAPAFHVSNDVNECSTQRPMTNIEFAVQV